MLIHRELGRGEWYSHSERCWIRNVEGGDPFIAKNGAGAGEHRTKFRLVDLHSLFYDCTRSEPDSKHIEGVDAPSNGFINASLAIVAEAPARASKTSGQRQRQRQVPKGAIINEDPRAENHWCALPSLLPPVNSLMAS